MTVALHTGMFGQIMKVKTLPGQLKKTRAEAVVVCCPDFRLGSLEEPVRKLMHAAYGIVDYYAPQFAGGVMRLAHDRSCLKEFMKDFGLFYKGHCGRHLITLSHDDCVWCKATGHSRDTDEGTRLHCAESMYDLKRRFREQYADVQVSCGHLTFHPEDDELGHLPILLPDV